MMQRRNRISGPVLLLIAMGLLMFKSIHMAQAQAIYGSIYGQVTDQHRRRRAQRHDHRNR